MDCVSFIKRCFELNGVKFIKEEDKEIKVPANIEINEFGNSLSIKFKRNQIVGKILLGFSTFWNLFLWIQLISGFINEDSPSIFLCH